MKLFRHHFTVPSFLVLFFYSAPSLFSAETATRPVVEVGPAEQLMLPAPYASRGVANPSQVVGWPNGKLPSAPAGFEVSLFADDLDNPRMIYVLPNGDVLVMESNPKSSDSRIILLRVNQNNQMVVRQPFVRRLNLAFGMALSGSRFYIGNTDGVVVVPRSRAAEIARLGAERVAKEQKSRERLRNGELGLDFYGLRNKLSELGVRYVDEND